MTQEELDALMDGDVDLENLEEEVAAEESVEERADDGAEAAAQMGEEYRPFATNTMPPPATEDHKVVHQLDDVTKESEEKASEIFDIIEGVSNELMEAEPKVEKGIETLESNIALFHSLIERFPDIKAFKAQLEKNEEALQSANEMLETLHDSGDAIMNVMDIMQYQDIHRQKIERVINVMRALTGYMNTLFEGRVEDEKRVGSATHLPGDSTDDVVSNDDIEALLASLGQ